ncbi:MAG: hypothetical protein GY937_01655 [bacterium]|nr:hypothetical protein [bacterium]
MSHPFVLLATQRTGSSVVWRTLDTHSSVYARGEMFMKRMEHPESYAAALGRPGQRLLARLSPAWSVRRYLDQFYADRPETTAIGFKLMYSQLQPEIWRWIETHEARVLHLVRRNALKILISKAAAEATGMRHLTPGEQHEPQPVSLDVASLGSSLDRITSRVEAHRARIAALHHLEITYEELLDEPQALFDRCFGFLGVEPRPVELALRKLTPNTLREALANYDEVASALENTPHAALLEA